MTLSDIKKTYEEMTSGESSFSLKEASGYIADFYQKIFRGEYQVPNFLNDPDWN